MVVDRFLRRSGSRVSILNACRRTVSYKALSLCVIPIPSRTTRKSSRPRASDRSMCCQQATAGLSAPGTDPRRRYLIKMEPRWKKKIREFLEMIPPLRGGDFQGIAGLSSDGFLLVGVNSARVKFQKRPRAVKHRLDEPGQIIPQHGCVPALPPSVSPGSGNFSRTSTRVVRQFRTKRLSSLTGAGSQATVLHFRSREEYSS